MKVIEHYYCTNSNGNICSTKGPGTKFLKGTIEGETDVPVVLQIAKLEGNVVYAMNGEKYRLGKKNQELCELEQAISEGRPILKNWYITKIPSGKYVLCGTTRDGREIAEIIIDQEGNFVTLANGIKYLVIWLSANMSYDQKKKLRRTGVLCGLRVEPTWLNSAIRPCIPAFH